MAALDWVEALARLSTPPEMVGVSAWHMAPPAEPFTPSIPTKALHLPRTGLYWSWNRARWPPVERATGPVDVIHATAMAVPPRTAPLVVSVHDLAFLHHPDYFTARGLRFFKRSLALTHTQADLVVTPSQHSADDCVAAGISSDRVRVVPNTVDDGQVNESEAEATRRRFGVGERFVLWVGTAEPRKNLDRLLEAWKRLGRTGEELVLVGPAGWKSNLGRTVASAGPSVRRLGFVSDADKRALMRAASVVCYPSLTEGFGLPVLEAMMQATPVVASAAGALPEVVGTAGLLVNPTRVEEISEALVGLLDDPGGAAALGWKGRDRAVAEFSWSRTAEGLMAVYEELAR